MSRTWKDSNAPRDGRRRNITVRAVRRDPPDLRRLSRALLELAMLRVQAEQEAQQVAEARQAKKAGAGGGKDV